MARLGSNEGSKSVALYFGFYGAQVQVHMNFWRTTKTLVAYAISKSLTLSPVKSEAKCLVSFTFEKCRSVDMAFLK